MLFSQLICLLFLVFCTPYVISLSFIFNGFKNLNHNNLTINQVAKITSHGILKLTNDTPQTIGHAFYPNPIRFKTPTTKRPLSFSTSFVFATKPKKGNHGGHGLAFTVSPAKELVGAQPNHYLGLLNVTSNRNSSNHLFAIEFDTVLDLEFSDINDNHVGININSIISTNSTSAGFFVQGDSTKHDLDMKSGKKIQAWIDYDALNPQVNVTLSMSSEKPKTPILSVPMDLSSVFQDFMYIGFSAATGELASSHYIFGWSFNTSGKAQSLDLSNLPSVPEPKKNRTGLIIGVSVAVLLAIIAIAGVVSLIKKLNGVDKIEEWELDVGPHRYSYNELKKATKGFSNDELLGFGGFGSVYQGLLPESKIPIAVKRVSNNSQQGMRTFVSEISTIGRLRHRNLVQLLGWCRKKDDLLLVYDFMDNGSLDKYIYNNPRIILTWEQRFKIVKDVACGLLYLHEEWEQTVLHRDIKAANVLLDSELNGRLGDFGLAKLCDHESNSSTTRVVGTLGYLAPELTRTGKPTTNSDMFAFGALLLEVVCGRRPTEQMASPEELILVDWVWDKWTKKSVLEVVDSQLKGEFNEMEVLVVIKLGLMCSSNTPLARPSMRQVVRYLEGEVPLPEKLAPPWEGGWSGGQRWEFEDYVHSYPSTSVLDNGSNLTLGVDEEFVDVEADLSSPFSISSNEESILIC